MKKRILFVCLLAVIIPICLMVFSACNKTPEQQDTEKSSVSYMQKGLYCGQNEEFILSVSYGKSENVFIANGVVGEMSDFAVLSVKPIHEDMLANSYQYKLIGANGELSGELRRLLW